MVARVRMLSCFCVLLAAGLWFAALVQPTAAASFDCELAKQPLEELICGDPDLSALDDKLAATYKATLAKLDAQSTQTIKTSQRAWLKFLRGYCEATDRASWTTAECVEMEYETRISDLSDTLTVQSGFTILQVAESQVIKIEAGPTYPAETGHHHIVYSQIISPQTPETARWNQVNQTWARTERMDEEQNPHVEVSAIIRATLPNFVSVEKSVYWMGAAHMWGLYWNENTLLPTGEELKADRIFKADSGWQSFLAARAFENIEPQPGDLEVTPGLIENLVQEPESWTIAADTLTVNVDPDSSYGRGYPDTDVVYAWRDLKPYLRSDLPIKLNLN